MKFLRENSLGIVLILAFIVLLTGQFLTGHASYNEELAHHGRRVLSGIEYVSSGHFLEATSENWESEFLQMGAYVLLTVFLVQRGAAESKDPDKSEEVDDISHPDKADMRMPWPVRKGGLVLKLYSHSLSLSFLALFLATFVWHAYGGYKFENEERALNDLVPETFTDFVSSPQFWFQSLQNWQSEFLAMASIVLLSIWLREKSSPESKPVAAFHAQTGK